MIRKKGKKKEGRDTRNFEETRERYRSIEEELKDVFMKAKEKNGRKEREARNYVFAGERKRRKGEKQNKR